MADKKISELPLITTISGSIVYVPVVHDGITEKITIQDFSKYTSQYSAHTGSANIFTANQTINANLSVSGTSTVSGNASVGGNLVVNGKLTAQEIFTEITSASVIFESGSTIFGNSGDDTHQFSGSVSINGISIGAGAINEFTASQLAVNLRIASTTGSINTTTSSFDSVFLGISSVTGAMNTQSSSQDLVNRQISSTTGSINTTTSSFDSVFLRISSTTGSINTTTSSFNSVFLGISSVTGAMNTQSSSQDLVNRGISSTTGSINTTTSSFDSVFLRISSTTGSINTTTSSFDSEFGKIGSTTSSIHFTTQSLNIQTGSQSNLNAQIGIATASLNFTTGALNSFTGSVIGQTNTISTFTASVNFTTQSLNTQTGSQGNLNAQIGIATASLNFTTQSLNTQTGSQQSMNTTLSIVTGSMRAEIGGIEAYTASLKSAIIVNGSSVRIIGELTASRIYTEFITSSVLFVTGSNIIGDQSTDKHEFTGSVHINDTLFIKGQAIGLGELNAFTGSQINKDFTLSKVTASIDAHILGISTYTSSTTIVLNSIDAHILKQSIQTGSQDLVNLGISTYTGSQNVINTSIDAHILKQAIQTGSQDLVNLGISTFTGSLRSEVNLIEAYTASLKAASIVSSSTQVQNYDVFALNSNLYNGTGSIKGEIAGIEAYTASLKAAAIVSSSQQITNYYKFAETASANTFYGNQSIRGNAIINGGNSVRLYESTNTNYWDTYTYTDNTLRVNYNGAGGDEIILYNDGSINFSGAVTASGNISVGANSFTSPGGADKFIGVFSGQDSSIILQDSVETWEMYMNDDLYFTTGSTSPKAVMSLRRVTGNVEINEGNLVIGKAGKGIDFSITSNGSGTTGSELLNDYEEGTWTPTYTGTNLTVVTYGNQFGWYTKVGRLVTVTICIMTEDITVIGSENLRIGGLPFTSNSGTQAVNALVIGDSSRWATNPPKYGVLNGNSTEIFLYRDSGATGAGTDPVTVKTDDMADATGNRNMVRGTLTYFV